MSLVAGLVVTIVALVVAVVVLGVGRSSGTREPSAACRRAAECCRKMGNSPACDNYLRQSGAAADKACADSVKAFQHLGQCR